MKRRSISRGTWCELYPLKWAVIKRAEKILVVKHSVLHKNVHELCN